jgi:hypothetical protein
VTGNLETNSAIAFRRAALLGQGIIMTPAPLVFDDLRSGALVSILSDFLQKQFSIDAFYPHRAHLPAKVRTFIDLLVDDLRQIDRDPCAPDQERSNSSVLQAVPLSDPPPTPKRKGNASRRGRR